MSSIVINKDKILYKQWIIDKGKCMEDKDNGYIYR